MAAKNPLPEESDCKGTENGHSRKGAAGAAISEQAHGAPQIVSAEDIEHLVVERTAELSAENERLRQELATASPSSEERVRPVPVDITERKRAEDALWKSGELYRELVEGTNDLVTRVDGDGRFAYANRAAETILGVEPEACVGLSAFDFIHPEDRDRTQHWFEDCVRDQVEWATIENRQVSRTGEVCHMLWMTNFHFDDSGTVIGINSITRDITERKQAEEEREELITKLETQNAELERFTYTVSHDLKSPLITIGAYVGMLREDLAEGDPEPVENDLSRISSATEKMAQLLANVLELSRIGRVVNQPEDVSLEELAHEAFELIGGQARENGVQVEISPDLPVVFGDRLRLLEVLQNLIENSLKYMGDQSQPRVEIGSRLDGNETVYYVRDNGIGIDPRYHEKVFGLFDQLDPQVEGSGIGLSLAKRIIEVHGGRIWVESEGPGHGSTFCFTIAAR